MIDMWDWVVIGCYFLGIAGIVAWSARRQKSAEDYFLAGRNIGWFVIGASLFASNIGSEHLVGLAGSGASDGMAMAHYELHAWCLLVLGWVFVPFYSRSMVFTMPEFLEKRYNPASRWMLSLVSLVAYVFTKVSVTLYAGGIVFRALLPSDAFHWALPAVQYFFPGVTALDPFWVGAAITVVLTGIYTVLGGLRAVVYTDAMQAVVLIGGSIFVTIYGLIELGGWDELRRLCTEAPRLGQAATQAAETKNFFNMWRPWDDPDFPWAGILFGAPIVGLWYWCTDQYIVQRTLAAKSIRQARRGTIWGAYLKLTPVFLFIVPGMIAYALARAGKPIGLDLSVAENADLAYPALVKYVLPVGLRGL
ncbi:MAG: sodium:solute symporter family transporter, partial [Planctomycetota bacterium]